MDFSNKHTCKQCVYFSNEKEKTACYYNHGKEIEVEPDRTQCKYFKQDHSSPFE